MFEDDMKTLEKIIEKQRDEIEELKKEIKILKDENFRLEYMNTRIKGALFEFEMNYYEDNLKGDKS